MNILILSPFLPYPLDQGGKIRIFNLVKVLSRSHSVTLAAIVDDANLRVPSQLSVLCSQVILFERPARLWGDRFSFFTSNAPYNVIRYSSRQMRQSLEQLHRERKFDLVQIEFSMMWQYARLFPDIPVVLDAHNVEYMNVEQIGSQAKSIIWKGLYRLERRRLKATEQAAWRECAHCFSVSDEERNLIAAAVGNEKKVVTAVNGVDPERFDFRPRVQNSKKILFLGGMDYAPNLDAATFFLGDIFPMVKSQDPEASVVLVGRELDRLKELRYAPGVQCHESVPEVLPWFHEADVLAVPLRLGAGTRIKVLEAMAAGLPIVTTSKGCEGIAAENGKHLTVADTARDFAKAVVDRLNNPEQNIRLAQNARDLIMQSYTWQTAANTMNVCYDTLHTSAMRAKRGLPP